MSLEPGIVALEPIKAISFIDESNIWLARWSKIHHSNDNGATWSSRVPESLADGEQVRGLTFADVNHGWAVGSDGRIWQYDSLVTSIVEPESNEQQPLVFSLYQNYPNPFNPETVIEYQLLGYASSVRLRIYNVTGQEVRTLVNQEKQIGSYRVRWDGRDDGGKVVPAGVYFYRLEVSGAAGEGRKDFIQTRKMSFLK
ncbi:MAG: gliding motility-associated C-terminal domain-containing protein [Calditrichaeota bacterium]|nr:gliding motility-associated C-terminal domain-containing protein [Calditrichota bacterium]